MQSHQSRGEHQRSDFPETDPNFEFNCIVKMSNNEDELIISKFPKEVKKKPLKNCTKND